MIIDAHTHVYAWPKIVWPNREARHTFTSVERQIEFMDSLGIDQAVILPLNNAEAPAEPQSLGEILWIRDRYPGRFIPYCNIDPRLPLAPELISKESFLDLLEQHRDAGCYGLGELTARIPWFHPALRALLGACEEIGFPVIFHTITPDVSSYGVIDEVGLPGLELALKAFPRLAFVGHSPGFWSEISGEITLEEKSGYPKGPVAPGGTVVRLLRECPNLYADLSAGSGFNALARDERFALGFIEELAERLFFGLDCNSPECSTALLPWLVDHHAAGEISGPHFDAIMGGNIMRVLGIDDVRG